MITLALLFITLSPLALVAMIERQATRSRRDAEKNRSAAMAWRIAHRNARRVRRLP